MNELKKIWPHLQPLLQAKLEKFSREKLTSNTCIAIYGEIFNVILELLEKSELLIQENASARTLSNNAVNYIAQSLYDGLVFNNNEELLPDIFTPRVFASSLSLDELKIICVIFNDVPSVAYNAFEEFKAKR